MESTWGCSYEGPGKKLSMMVRHLKRSRKVMLKVPRIMKCVTTSTTIPVGVVKGTLGPSPTSGLTLVTWPYLGHMFLVVMDAHTKWCS